MKKLNIEKAIETLYSRGLTNEANLLSIILPEIEKNDDLVDSLKKANNKIQNLIKKGGQRRGLLESIYQDSIIMSEKLKLMTLLEE